MAAYLRTHGYTAEAVDAETRRQTPREIATYLQQGGFEVLGISATTASFHRAVELAEVAKSALPALRVIVGGPHVSSQPLETMLVPAFDYAVPCEGEETLLETLVMIENGGEPSTVRGLVYRDGRDVISTAARPYIENLDSLPFPDYEQIPDMLLYRPPPFNYRQRPVANMITSRGCPNECTFCCRTTFGRRVRMRSAEHVVNEIEQLLMRYHVREIAFVDDTFTLNPPRVFEIFDLAARRNLSFSWSCKSRIDTVSEELLRYMKSRGCWYIAFGIESGDKEILKEIRKNIRLSDVERIVALCKQIGLTTKGYFMVGHPKESLATIDKTIALATRLQLDHVAVTINTPMPGTYQFQHASEFGSLNCSSFSAFTFWHPVFVPSGLTRQQLVAKHREFLRRFYLRREWLFQHLRSTLGRSDTIVQIWYLLKDLARLAHERASRTWMGKDGRPTSLG